MALICCTRLLYCNVRYVLQIPLASIRRTSDETHTLYILARTLVSFSFFFHGRKIKFRKRSLEGSINSLLLPQSMIVEFWLFKTDENVMEWAFVWLLNVSSWESCGKLFSEEEEEEQIIINSPPTWTLK
jgi:hypothetical protein